MMPKQPSFFYKVQHIKNIFRPAASVDGCAALPIDPASQR
jgi:hypothetical protein